MSNIYYMYIVLSCRDEKESLVQKVNMLEHTLSTVLAEKKMFSQMFAVTMTKVSKLTNSINEFKERYGTGEPEKPVVVRQTDDPIPRDEFKNLVLEDKDIVKVNINKIKLHVDYIHVISIKYFYSISALQG